LRDKRDSTYYVFSRHPYVDSIRQEMLG
jgi:hypothetical protein